MQKCYKLLLTLILIVALSQSQTRTKCIKITGFPLAHSSLCFQCNLQARLGAELTVYLDPGFTDSCWDLVLSWTYQDAESVAQRIRVCFPHIKNCIHGMSCWCHTLTQMVKSLVGDKQRKRQGEWDSESSPQWSAREKNHLSFDDFCLYSY